MWLAALFLAAMGLRIWSVGSLRDDPRIAEPVLDGMLYLQAARDIAAGAFHWDQVFFQSPLYPLILGSLFRVAPPEVISIQIFQSLLGILSGLLLYWAARRWIGVDAAMIATALWVLYGPILGMENEVVPATLLLVLTTASLYFWPRPNEGQRAVAFGIVTGLATAVSGVFAILLAFAALGIATSRSSPARSRWISIAYLGAGALLAIAPLSIHQSRESGHLLLLTPNSGLNLYLGNNSAARGIYSSPPDVDLEADFTGTQSASRLAQRPLTLVESSRFWRDRALAFFADDPARAAWLLGRKALLYLTPREVPQIENFSRVAADTPALRVAFLRFGWILPFAALGLIAHLRTARSSKGAGLRQSPPRSTALEATREAARNSAGAAPRKSAREAPPSSARAATSSEHGDAVSIYPFLALILTGWISTIAFFTTGRFRIPIVSAFLALAALGLLELWRAREGGRRLVTGLGIVLAIFGLQWMLPTYPVARADANADYLLGLRLAQRGDHEDAIAIFERAIELDPTSGEPWHGIGVSRSEQRRFEAAVEAYRHAIRLMPLSTWTHFNLGLCLEQLGRHGEAARAFADAVVLQPNDPNLRYRLGASLAQQGRTAEAIEQLEVAQSLDPSQDAVARLLSRIRSGE